MSIKEWEAQKKKLHAEGADDGHQSALRFLKNVLDLPEHPFAFGSNFPEDLKETVYQYVEMARGRIIKKDIKQ